MFSVGPGGLEPSNQVRGTGILRFTVVIARALLSWRGAEVSCAQRATLAKRFHWKHGTGPDASGTVTGARVTGA